MTLLSNLRVLFLINLLLKIDSRYLLEDYPQPLP